MDRLPNLTLGQNCVPGVSSFFWDKLLVTAPSWDIVNQDLRWFFLLHTYAFACLFFVLSFYTFFSFLNLRSLNPSLPLMSTINIFLCILGATRSGCLFVDPYNLKEIMPKIVGSIMWDIGFPFITSAFCLVQLAFIQLTQVKFCLEKLHKETYLSLIIILHLSCVVLSNVSLAFHISYMVKYVGQAVFLQWALLLYVSFFYAGGKVKALLNRLPSNLLARDSASANQKGIMQLAILAPYNSLATSVAAALVPTLLGPKLKALEAGEPTKGLETNPSYNSSCGRAESARVQLDGERSNGRLSFGEVDFAGSTVPEVYVRPPTPTPSVANLPTITVSSPSRRSSVASRRGSDVSRLSRRASDCSVRFAGAEGAEGKPSPDADPRRSPSLERPRSPEGILRRNSDCGPTPGGSSKDLRRSSDFCHEKSRSQFATKLRRNSDFGNRTPRRAQEPEQSKLARILDVSPAGSRRNSDLGGLVAVRAVESRRNSDISCRANDYGGKDGKIGGRRTSELATIRAREEPEVQQLQEGETEPRARDNEKAALVNGDEGQGKGSSRRKNLSWKPDKSKPDQEEITAETSLLAEGQVTGADFTLHSILNHIAYVNRSKSDTPLHIPEAMTAAARRAQIMRVLKTTYATAILGIVLCLADAGRIFGPYGLMAEVVDPESKPAVAQFPKAWPWIIYQTICRFLELIMACTMASITKQPSASLRHQYLNHYPNYNLRMKQRDNLYM